MLSVIELNVIMSVIVLNVIMLSVIVLNVIVLSVLAPFNSTLLVSVGANDVAGTELDTLHGDVFGGLASSHDLMSMF